jgi:hypothetical protein
MMILSRFYQIQAIKSKNNHEWPWNYGFYAKDRNMKEFTDYIRDSEIYHLITDSKINFLSFSLLINSDHSKIKLSKKCFYRNDCYRSNKGKNYS